MGAQYSVPFALAIAAHFDPEDPKAFLGESLDDPDVRRLAERIEVSERPGSPIRGWSADLAITLVTGTILEGSQSDFRGCPQSPLSRTGLFDKFERLCESMDAQRRVALFESLWNLESAPDLSRLTL
jgi:2-methylcitrate dehydratase PrpD